MLKAFLIFVLFLALKAKEIITCHSYFSVFPYDYMSKEIKYDYELWDPPVLAPEDATNEAIMLIGGEMLTNTTKLYITLMAKLFETCISQS